MKSGFLLRNWKVYPWTHDKRILPTAERGDEGGPAPRVAVLRTFLSSLARGAGRLSPALAVQSGVQSGANMNRWGIPDWLEEEVKERDKACVYCGTEMTEQIPRRGLRKSVATWEHMLPPVNSGPTPHR